MPPPGKSVLWVEVTNAKANLTVYGEANTCETPCALQVAPGRRHLTFKYLKDGELHVDSANVTVSQEPTAYVRTMGDVRIHSRAGRIVGMTMWIVGSASMAAGFAMLRAKDHESIQATRRGLGWGGLGSYLLMFPVAAYSVKRTKGVGVQFPWHAQP